MKSSIFLKSWLLAVVVVWTIVGFGKANASPEVNSGGFSSQTKSSQADFDPKFGLGVTGLVASGTLYPMKDVFWTYYHGGIQLDFLWKVHPRLSLLFSPGFLMSNSVDVLSDRLVEIPFSLALRVHLRTVPLKSNQFFLMPYVLFSFQSHFLIGAGPTYDGRTPWNYYTVPPSVYVGGGIGGGGEFRMGDHVSISVEIRGFAQGPINLYDYGVWFPSRLGILFSVGTAVYF